MIDMFIWPPELKPSRYFVHPLLFKEKTLFEDTYLEAKVEI